MNLYSTDLSISPTTLTTLTTGLAMKPLPTLFISHGAPDLILHPGETTAFFQQLGQSLPTPQAILVISAHWNTSIPTVSSAPHPRTIYDFSGFPAPLYQLTYPAPGAPELATRVGELLNQNGLPHATHPDRGLDHGAWSPLLLIYPHADIPVTQLSIQFPASPAHHFQLGQALEPLRQEGILILASGGATHNLRAFDSIYNATPPDWVSSFDDWLADRIGAGDTESLLHYRQFAPNAEKNHPTEDHLLPLFVALGAAGTTAKGTALHRSYVYGAFSMAAYAFN